MSIDFPSKYNNWDRVDPSELFLCPTEKKEATAKLKMPAFLASEAKGADYLVRQLSPLFTTTLFKFSLSF